MKTGIPILVSLCALTLLGAPHTRAADSLDLSGSWGFALDPTDQGISQAWFTTQLSQHRIQLPGLLQAQGFGNAISTNTPWVLSLYDRNWFLRQDYRDYAAPGKVKVPFICQPPKHYLGPAWYQHDVLIPQNWAGRRIVLHLERPHWESIVWLDDRPCGTNNSLVAPHEYDLGSVQPGKHRLTVRVDNRMLMPYRPDAHSVSDSLGQSWNGIAGRIDLLATSPVYIEDAQVFPNVAQRSVSIRVRIGNPSGRAGKGTLTAGSASVEAAWNTNGASVTLEVPLGPKAALWDEFNPALHRLTLRLRGDQADDSRELVFGLREFAARGNQFVVNGRPVHLRGTHHGGDFPLTGAPPTDVAYWKKLFLTCKEWGLNHVRFHSYCPPDAAFTAADEVGIYLQPECGMWNELSPGTAMERMMYAETERMIKAYGNHPSFVLLSPSNEPKARWKQSLPVWVQHFRARDPRRLYTTGTGWSLIDSPGPVTGADFLAVHRIGNNMLRGNSAWFGRDYSRSLSGVNVPVATHELGQWCAYPDFSVIEKFTGYLRPGNYEIFRDSAARNGLLPQNRELAHASGRFQAACYKEEIEAVLRTPGLRGFQLLDLHDYVGQGTALVGLLDPFWESKGYIDAAEFRRFCSPTVPLARLQQRIFTAGDKVRAQIEVAHYGPADLADAQILWQVRDAKAGILREGSMPPQTLPTGTNSSPGIIEFDTAGLQAPQALTLVVRVSGAGTVAENDWNFWLYPPPANAPEATGDVVVSSQWPEVKAALEKNKKALFLVRGADLDWTCPPLDSLPIFWNRLMNPGWGLTLGLWCDAAHPALSAFPTSSHCDWQWTEILRRSRAVNLEGFPRELRPIVQPIDDWNRNYKLASLFECRVGPGRLMVCSLDLESRLEERPVARQLRDSVLRYMKSEAFQPRAVVPASALEARFFDNLVMRKLGATLRGPGPTASAIDGDPNTFWLSAGPSARFPVDLTLELAQPVPISGLVIVPRQNHREHEGDIRQFKIYTGETASTWSELTAGELASTFEPQKILFPTVTTRHLRFEAVSGYGPGNAAALAEIAVIYAGTNTLGSSPAGIEYKRVRSATEEVDEGNPNP